MRLEWILRMLVPPIIPAVMGRMRPVERQYVGAAGPARTGSCVAYAVRSSCSDREVQAPKSNFLRTGPT